MARSAVAIIGNPWQKWRRLDTEIRWGVGIMFLVVALSVLVPIMSPYDAELSAGDPLLPPSIAHPFGTDQLGRDMFVRTFAAAQLDIALAVIGVVIPLTIGTFIGAVAGTTRNTTVGHLWTVIVDGINAFPFFVLVMAVVGVVGQGVGGILFAMALTLWARYARLARARALAIRQAEFIQATQILGYSRTRILLRHVVPNVYSETLAYGLSQFALVIVAIAGLSFLGIGVRPPTPEWGAMMSEGRILIMTEPWITLFPGLLLTVTAVSVALVAERLVSQTRGESY